MSSSSTSRCARPRARRSSGSPSDSSSSQPAGCSAPSTPRSSFFRPPTGDGPLRSVSGAEGELLMHPEERFTPADATAFRAVASTSSAMLLTQRRAAKAFDAFLRSRGLEDAILAPLRGENRTFGLLVVGERLGDVSTFVDTDVELLETFAGHASILLENGRLEHSLAEVTQLKEQLRHQAYHDALTGPPQPPPPARSSGAASSSVARVRRPSSISTSTVSRRSTTPGDTARATSSSPSSRAASRLLSASRTSPPGSAATSSPSSSARRTQTLRSPRHGACSRGSTGRTRSDVATSPAM